MDIIEKRQRIGNNFRKGTFSNIGENVLIGDNVTIGNGVILYDGVIIGSDVNIGDFVTVNAPLNYKNSESGKTVIGDGVDIYSYTLIQAGIGDNSTSIDSGTRILGHSTVGYNARIRQNAIIATESIIGHDVEIGEASVINARSYIRPGVKVGKLAHIATISSIEYDVIPFSIVKGIPPFVENINLKGLKSYGYNEEEIEIVMRAFEIIFNEGYTNKMALDIIKEKLELKEIVKEIIAFMGVSIRGILK